MAQPGLRCAELTPEVASVLAPQTALSESLLEHL